LLIAALTVAAVDYDWQVMQVVLNVFSH